MKRAIIMLTGFMLLATQSFATQNRVPETMNYQGVLTEDNGTQITGTRNFTFQIWDALSGGSSVWGPYTYNSVQVTGGLFNVSLGSPPGNPLTIAFDHPYWLQVSVNGTPMSPRVPITSSPYALSLRLPFGSRDTEGTASSSEPALAIKNSGSGHAIQGTSTSNAGVLGTSTTGNGLVGVSANSDAITAFASAAARSAVYGLNSFVDGSEFPPPSYGLLGVASNRAGRGVWGFSTNGTGVWGSSETEWGVRGESTSGLGVYGSTNNASNYGGYFRNFAGGTALKADGLAQVKVLEILGGADVAERFAVHGENIEPGTVVVIDPASPGALRLSTEECDPKVAGIVSGAGGIKPGMLLGQKGSVADGEYQIALTGRVYCWCDASYGTIQPGDALTTSATPGHAMKLTNENRERARGAILGKAMTELKEGRGLVLVLVGLN